MRAACDRCNALCWTASVGRHYHGSCIYSSGYIILKDIPMVWDHAVRARRCHLSSSCHICTLACALPVLGTLDIQGPCTFSRHGFDPQDVPLLSGMLPRLEIVNLGRDCCLYSDRLSIADLVDLFSHTGVNHRLQWVETCMMAQSKPSVNIAINTLVLRAGQSLRWINLDPIAEENPLLYSAMPPEVAQSLAHRLCIWGNTHLLVLRYSVDVINQHESYVAPIVERLNQVASASISDIHLAFHIANEVFLPKLCDSLAQIDTALCGTVLYSARLVKISLCGVASSKQIAKAKVRSCLPKLDSRGILSVFCE